VTAQLQLFAPEDRSDRWLVRTSRRARRLSVRVYPGGRVEIVAPPGASAAVVQRFIGQHRQWIDARVQDFAALPAAATDLPERIVLAGVGRQYTVEYQSTGRPSIAASGSVLRVRGSQERHAVAIVLRRWICELAFAELGARLQTVSSELQLPFKRLQIRRQRTRWGSCSASGTISLNACLLFIEPAVVRYLMVHELCHTQHMNHSARFWGLVAHHEPDFRRLDRVLLRGWQQVPWWMFG
jgi:predicted metal-dependent hydrolase